jgi:DNA primase
VTVISEVKQRLDLVEVVSNYVSLQKAGRYLKGLCPFHSEKHPSFFVYPEQQTWHCFGACATGGDVFAFVMKKEGLDFRQALRFLAQKAGVDVSQLEGSTETKGKEKERLFQINETAARYYHHLLLNTRAGETARNYLARRKVSLETVRDFLLGVSPDGWEIVKNYLRDKGYAEQELINAGLVIEGESGTYDRFRNRLVFPICDIDGHVVGFGARALDDSLPKYINSPQTAVFDKGSLLYGIDKARTAIRKENLVVIVEGYMDVLAAHQCGWQNVVGSMGTSLTEKQVDIVKRLTSRVALALDADIAGEEAILRGGTILSHSNAEAKVVLLPSGKDPDEIINEDLTLWQRLVQEAVPILDFAFQSVLSKVDTSSARGKSLAVQKLLPALAETRDPVQRSHYMRRLAQQLRIEESAIKAAWQEFRRMGRRWQHRGIAERSELAVHSASSRLEEYCLTLLLRYPELRPLAQELCPEHFEHTENKEIFARWQQCQSNAELGRNLDPSLSEHLHYLMSKPLPPGVEQSEQKRQLDFINCALRLQEAWARRLERAKQALLEAEREKGGTGSELFKLEELGIDSAKRLHEIFLKRRISNGPNQRKRF